VSLHPGHVALALAVAVSITVVMRAIPFGLKNAMKGSALLADLGRWMPLGAIAILAIYGLTSINLTAPDHGIPVLVGVGVTIAVHTWRHNLVLSLVAGTMACLVLSN
jgi:branched-subunit amino acid transport protein AzlD